MKRIIMTMLMTVAIYSGVFAQSRLSVYISANGNDDYYAIDDESKPCLTFTQAFTLLYLAREQGYEVNTITVIGTLNLKSGTEGHFALFSVDEQEILITGKPGATGAERAVLSTEGERVTVPTGRIRLEHIEISGGGPGILLLNSRVTLGSGAVIRGNSSNGIAIMEGGTCVIDGGEVRDNAAAGVIVGVGGVLIMRNGVIRDNRSSSNNIAGGVHIFENGTFSMYGGSITGNRTSGSGGGVYVKSRGRFDQTGGTISNNTAPQSPNIYRESGSLGTNR